MLASVTRPTLEKLIALEQGRDKRKQQAAKSRGRMNVDLRDKLTERIEQLKSVMTGDSSTGSPTTRFSSVYFCLGDLGVRPSSFRRAATGRPGC